MFLAKTNFHRCFPLLNSQEYNWVATSQVTSSYGIWGQPWKHALHKSALYPPDKRSLGLSPLNSTLPASLHKYLMLLSVAFVEFKITA